MPSQSDWIYDPTHLGNGASAQLLIGENCFSSIIGSPSIVTDGSNGTVIRLPDGASLFRTVPSGTEFTVGFRCRQTAATASDNAVTLGFYNAASQQILKLNMNTAAVLTVQRGATVLATFAQSFFQAQLFTLEFAVALDDSVGKFEGKIEGVVDVTEQTGVDTNNTADPNCTLIEIGSRTSFFDISTLYIRSGYKQYRGPGLIVPLYPNGDNGTNNWTRSTGAGTHFSHVNKTAHAATPYLETDAANAEHFTLEDLSDAGSVLAVQRFCVATRPTGGAGTVRLDVESGATVDQGVAQVPKDTTFGVLCGDCHSVDPNTGSAWARAAVDALKTRLVYP